PPRTFLMRLRPWRPTWLIPRSPPATCAKSSPRCASVSRPEETLTLVLRRSRFNSVLKLSPRTGHDRFRLTRGEFQRDEPRARDQSAITWFSRNCRMVDFARSLGTCRSWGAVQEDRRPLVP